VVPGTYSFQVYPINAGIDCAQLFDLTIVDEPIDILAVDDTFQTAFNTPISGNVILNDSGLDLRLLLAVDAMGGTVEFAEDGSFTFTPDANFTGTGGFEYNISDACLDQDVGEVIIEVAPPFGGPDTDTRSVEPQWRFGFTTLGPVAGSARPELPGIASAFGAFGLQTPAALAELSWYRPGGSLQRLQLLQGGGAARGNRLQVAALMGRQLPLLGGQLDLLTGPAYQWSSGFTGSDSDGLTFWQVNGQWQPGGLSGLLLEYRWAFGSRVAPGSLVLGLRYNWTQ